MIRFPMAPLTRVSLTRVSGANKNHRNPHGFGFVGSNIVQWPKGPAMQADANSYFRFDSVTDTGQIFPSNFLHIQPLGLLNDSPGTLVIDRFDMPPLATGESTQLLLSSAATVGSKTAAMSQVTVTCKPQLPAAEHLATTRGGEIVSPNCFPQHPGPIHRLR